MHDIKDVYFDVLVDTNDIQGYVHPNDYDDWADPESFRYLLQYIGEISYFHMGQCSAGQVRVHCNLKR